LGIMEDRMPSHPDRVRRNYDEAPVWRRPSANAAERLQRAEHRHDFCVRDWPRAGWSCLCGAFVGNEEIVAWNVIEGDPA
jgi:hypothetical protein